MKTVTGVSLVVATMILAGSADAAVLYVAGTAPAAAGSVTFGDHLVGAVSHPSVPGVGGSGLSDAGDGLDGGRTYIYDGGAQADLTDGVANRGDNGFAMMIWDMGTPFDSMRLYTHQDHYSGGPINDGFTAQDVMEYSVWGSADGDNFELLSDVVAFTLGGGGPGLPTYSFAGTAPTVVYRGGSAEFGILNAYTREYVFGTAYRYYGIRASQISLTARDYDPEIDAIGGFQAAERCEIAPNDPSCVPPPRVPEPGTLVLLGLGLAGLGLSRRCKAS